MMARTVLSLVTLAASEGTLCCLPIGKGLCVLCESLSKGVEEGPGLDASERSMICVAIMRCRHKSEPLALQAKWHSSQRVIVRTMQIVLNYAQRRLEADSALTAPLH